MSVIKPPTLDECQALCEPALRLAKRAGVAILDVYAQAFSVEQKTDDSPLTQADLASHAIICQGLRALTPSIPVLSEESFEIEQDAAQVIGSAYWLVDPLDGTKEFIARNGEFTINIALVINGEAVLGVIGIPVQDCWFVGLKGYGAQQQTGNQAAAVIHTRQAIGRDTLSVLASRSHGSLRLTDYLHSLPSHELQSVGSALKFTRIASGFADVYPRLGPTHYWDSAAGQAIVEAAGGLVVDTHGQALRYPTSLSESTPRCVNGDFLVLGDAKLLPALRWGQRRGQD